MPELSGVRVGRLFLERCAWGGYGVVHSVFDRVFNLRAGGLIFSVTALGVGGGARYLNTAAPTLRHLELFPGESCAFDPAGVTVGGTRATAAAAALWKSPVNAGDRGTLDRGTAEAFRAALERMRPRAGLHTGREPSLMALLAKTETVPRGVAGLLGLGPGLTPAGDDILLGYLAVMNHFGQDEAQNSALRREILRGLHRTVDLSAQALRDGVDGEYCEAVGDVLASLLRGGPIEPALSALLEIGASSGGDMAAGMRGAMERILDDGAGNGPEEGNF